MSAASYQQVAASLFSIHHQGGETAEAGSALRDCDHLPHLHALLLSLLHGEWSSRVRHHIHPQILPMYIISYSGWNTNFYTRLQVDTFPEKYQTTLFGAA
jgi:hypothetical protein